MWGIALTAAWILSLLGRQSLLRLLVISPNMVYVDTKVFYLSPALLESTPLQGGSSSGTMSLLINAAYLASLL